MRQLFVYFFNETGDLIYIVYLVVSSYLNQACCVPKVFLFWGVIGAFLNELKSTCLIV